MAYNGGNSPNESGSGNMWSSGSRGGSRGGYSRSNNYNDDNGSRGGGSYGSYGNNDNSRRGRGSYGFRQQGDSGDVQILKDAVYIQNLPKDITIDQLLDAFSSVGTIKTDERSGGPKIWIQKDRDTGEGNGRATVTYEDDESASRAVSEFNDQHIESIDSTVRVQFAQRRRNNDRGGRAGYRGGRSSWDNNNFRSNFNSDGNRWGSSGRGGGGFSSNQNEGFRSGGGDSFRDNDDRGGSYRGSRGGPYRGASRGTGEFSKYTPY